MTLPRPRRKIDVDGVTYPYTLKFPKNRFKGQSPAGCRITIQAPRNAYISVVLVSKYWQQDHEEGWMLPPHKAAVKPSDVREILISILKTGKAAAPPDWWIEECLIVGNLDPVA